MEMSLTQVVSCNERLSRCSVLHSMPACSFPHPCLQMVGKALKGLPRDEVVVATKMGRYGPDLFDFSAERVRAGVRESLERLQLSYIDILHAHDIEFRNIDQVGMGLMPG